MVRMMSAFPASAQVTSLVWMSLVLSGTQEGSFTTPWIGDSHPQRRVVIKFSCIKYQAQIFLKIVNSNIHSLTTPSSKVKEYIISLIGICVFDSDSSEGSNNKQLNISFSSIDHLFTCLSDQTGFDIWLNLKHILMLLDWINCISGVLTYISFGFQPIQLELLNSYFWKKRKKEVNSTWPACS